VPGIHIPEQVERRLRGVPSDRVAAEGISLCIETIQRLRDIPGVAGVHLMAFGYERGVPDIVRRAGVGPAAQPDLRASLSSTAVSTREGIGHVG
jgi:methylenetetrahydrofolate reductase (NADPH)